MNQQFPVAVNVPYYKAFQATGEAQLAARLNVYFSEGYVLESIQSSWTLDNVLQSCVVMRFDRAEIAAAQYLNNHIQP